jgi:site-specific DNA-methyltransferase (adenine-specific)/modification methylase
MTERVEIGGAVLYCGDCRDILPGLGRLGTIVSDPPYGIDYAHGGGAGRCGAGVTAAAAARGTPPIAGDAEDFDPAHLLEFSEVLIWGADHYRARLPESGRLLAWDKLAGLTPWDSFCDVEFAWHSRSGVARIYSWKGLAATKIGENNATREHPTQKPLGLMRWCIEQLQSSRLIIDPYMGSGTTGVAALQLGRRFVGIEIERRWFDLACRRIAEAAAQGQLDLPAPPRAARLAEQPDLLGR